MSSEQLLAICAISLTAWILHRQIEMERRIGLHQLNNSMNSQSLRHDTADAVRQIREVFSIVQDVREATAATQARVSQLESLEALEPGLYVQKADPTTGRRSMVKAQELEDSFVSSSPIDGYDAIELGIQQLTKDMLGKQRA